MTLEVNTGGLQTGTGGAYTVAGLTLTSAELRSTYDAVGVIPASQATAGFAITSNYYGLGETNFWNLVNGDANTQGWLFSQKTAAGTFRDALSIYSEAAYVNLDMYGSTTTFRFHIDATEVTANAVQAVPYYILTTNAKRIKVGAAGGLEVLAAAGASPTGGNQGVGTLNASALYDDGVQIKTVLTGTTGSIGGGALVAGQATSGTVAITGCTTDMAVIATPVTYPGDGVAWAGYVST